MVVGLFNIVFEMHVSLCITFHLPVCRYPPLSSHQYDITQLSGPQVALHLAESDISMGQSREHTLFWTCTWLHGHTRWQRGTAVGSPALTQWHPDKDRWRFIHTDTKTRILWVYLSMPVLFLCSSQTDRCVMRSSPAALCFFVPFPHSFHRGCCILPEADKSSLMGQLHGVNDQIYLAHLKTKWAKLLLWSSFLISIPTMRYVTGLPDRSA